MNILNELVFALSNTPYLGLIALVSCLFFAYKNYPGIYYFFILSIYFLSQHLGLDFWVIYLTFSLLLLCPPIRREIVTKPKLFFLKKLGLLPKISETEKIALTSGSVWVDGQLFSGNPDFNWIFSIKKPKLTKAEKSFLENEVE